MLKKFDKFIPFAKVDAAKREVWGIVTAEVEDRDGETCDYSKTVPYYKSLVEEMTKATDGKNIFPLREMHQLSAVGKGISIDFRDDVKQIYMGFKVVDNEAWKKVDEGVYTGFSHGGQYVEKFTKDGVNFYVADPVEVSLVDLPCLPVATYQYVKTDGATEMRKLRSQPLTKESVRKDDGEDMEDAAHKDGLDKGDTKRVAGEDLPPSAFLIVGDRSKTDTWHLPVHFSSREKTESHIRNALARINQVEGISEEERSRAAARLHSLAHEYGIGESDSNKGAGMKNSLAKRAATMAGHFRRGADCFDKAASECLDMSGEHETARDYHKAAATGSPETAEFHKSMHRMHKAMCASLDRMHKAFREHSNHLSAMAKDYDSMAAAAKADEKEEEEESKRKSEEAEAEKARKAAEEKKDDKQEEEKGEKKPDDEKAEAEKAEKAAKAAAAESEIEMSKDELTKTIGDALAALPKPVTAEELRTMVAEEVGKAVDAKLAKTAEEVPEGFSLVPRDATMVKAAGAIPAQTTNGATSYAPGSEDCGL